MKKKVLVFLMAVVMAAGSLAGCGKATEPMAERAEREYFETEEACTADEAPAEAAVGTSATRSGNSNYNGLKADNSVAAVADVYDYCEEEYIDDSYGLYDDYFDTSEFNQIKENGFSNVKVSPLSTFGADVDTASYTTLRQYINWGYDLDMIPTSALRAEEMLNYFSYDYKGPKKGEPFGVNAEISRCPWNEDSKLVMLGLQTEAIDFSDAPDSNIVFLIDVSGSMYDENKLPLLKKSFGLLVENFGKNDRVSVVTYAGSDQVVLEGAKGNQYGRIMDALDGLEAGGSTNGGQGIITAYELAEKYFIEGGNNRVILATDGDFNVGVTSQSDLYDLIDKEKETGVYLSVLGFGMYNYSDANMETLADHGNGNYAYIDSLSEAKKVLVEEMGATLVTVAKDVKLQVEFNPAVVSEYRLIGYENRGMAAEDFADDTKDGGEIGAGHSVTVLYEVVLADDADDDVELKYQKGELTDRATDTDEWFTLSVRYKEPDEDESKLLEYPIGDEAYTRKPSDDMLFAGCVAEFAMLLRDSEYAGDSSFRYIINTLDDMRNLDEYKQEFLGLVKTAREL